MSTKINRPFIEQLETLGELCIKGFDDLLYFADAELLLLRMHIGRTEWRDMKTDSRLGSSKIAKA